jgi:5-methylcytosine-specific restriction protein B
VDGGLLDEIERRIIALNEEIAGDQSLGKPYRIGHSYLTPPIGIDIANAREWFIQVVDTEIGPLLEEYWFDARDKAKDARKRLLDGL